MSSIAKPDFMARAMTLVGSRPEAPPRPIPNATCWRCHCDFHEPDGPYARVCWRCTLEDRQREFYREHRGATFADFTSEVEAVAREFLEPGEHVRGLFICGPAGTGKTRLLAALAAAGGGKGVTFGLVRGLLRETWNVETKAEKIADLARTPLLLLDDIGREGKPTEDVLATLHEVLSERNGEYRPTAVTSNYTLEQLAARYDDSIADRLRPWAKLVMAGRSRR